MEAIWTIEVSLENATEAAGEEGRLIAACRQGDEDAFGRLVRLHQHRVFRLAGRFFRRQEDVEELAQETFLTVWRKLATYSARAPFEHWITRVCLNCCYARLRRKRLAEQPLEQDAPVAAEAHDPTASIELERLLDRIAPADRFILLLLDGEGWTVEEIAQRLGWTRVNVKVRAHRARKKLRDVLESGS